MGIVERLTETAAGLLIAAAVLAIPGGVIAALAYENGHWLWLSAVGLLFFMGG